MNLGLGTAGNQLGQTAIATGTEMNGAHARTSIYKLCVCGRVYVHAMLSVTLSFYTLWEDARLLIDSVGVPTLIISLAFHTFWQYRLTPLGCPH